MATQTSNDGRLTSTYPTGGAERSTIRLLTGVLSHQDANTSDCACGTRRGARLELAERATKSVGVTGHAGCKRRPAADLPEEDAGPHKTPYS